MSYRNAHMKFPEWVEWWKRQPFFVRWYYSALWRLSAKWQRWRWETGAAKEGKP